jgi:hypothetical protein
VNEDNCYNSTELGFAEIYTIATINPNTGRRYDQEESAASTVMASLPWLSALLTVSMLAVL